MLEVKQINSNYTTHYSFKQEALAEVSKIDLQLHVDHTQKSYKIEPLGGMAGFKENNLFPVSEKNEMFLAYLESIRATCQFADGLLLSPKVSTTETRLRRALEKIRDNKYTEAKDWKGWTKEDVLEDIQSIASNVLYEIDNQIPEDNE